MAVEKTVYKYPYASAAKVKEDSAAAKVVVISTATVSDEITRTIASWADDATHQEAAWNVKVWAVDGRIGEVTGVTYDGQAVDSLAGYLRSVLASGFPTAEYGEITRRVTNAGMMINRAAGSYAKKHNYLMPKGKGGRKAGTGTRVGSIKTTDASGSITGSQKAAPGAVFVIGDDGSAVVLTKSEAHFNALYAILGPDGVQAFTAHVAGIIARATTPPVNVVEEGKEEKKPARKRASK